MDSQTIKKEIIKSIVDEAVKQIDSEILKFYEPETETVVLTSEDMKNVVFRVKQYFENKYYAKHEIDVKSKLRTLEIIIYNTDENQFERLTKSLLNSRYNYAMSIKYEK